MCVHCVCNQVGGTVNGLLGDGTDKMSVHVSGDRNACVAEQLAHHGDVSPGDFKQDHAMAASHHNATLIDD